KEDVVENTDSMTNLLKQHKVDISTVKANKTLVALGLLLDKERPSSKYAGKMKKYKALSAKGLEYGVNVENLNSPGQTTPHYFVDTFPELLALIQQEIKGPPNHAWLKTLQH
ncbi:MAG: hypothetical protein KKD73_10505, partial [Proteobacteria bacterium]|nr:hypothetical protein [Pseudomonadota bacterium]MBU1640913.1 hypothetical protein [Pseudomonadota bacterium]